MTSSFFCQGQISHFGTYKELKAAGVDFFKICTKEPLSPDPNSVEPVPGCLDAICVSGGMSSLSLDAMAGATTSSGPAVIGSAPCPPSGIGLSAILAPSGVHTGPGTTTGVLPAIEEDEARASASTSSASTPAQSPNALRRSLKLSEVLGRHIKEEEELEAKHNNINIKDTESEGNEGISDKGSLKDQQNDKAKENEAEILSGNDEKAEKNNYEKVGSVGTPRFSSDSDASELTGIRTEQMSKMSDWSIEIEPSRLGTEDLGEVDTGGGGGGEEEPEYIGVTLRRESAALRREGLKMSVCGDRISFSLSEADLMDDPRFFMNGFVPVSSQLRKASDSAFTPTVLASEPSAALGNLVTNATVSSSLSALTQAPGQGDVMQSGRVSQRRIEMLNRRFSTLFSEMGRRESLATIQTEDLMELDEAAEAAEHAAAVAATQHAAEEAGLDDAAVGLSGVSWHHYLAYIRLSAGWLGSLIILCLFLIPILGFGGCSYFMALWYECRVFFSLHRKKSNSDHVFVEITSFSSESV
ncbi:unnamed protein product [Protopolystoma xenopodis]|uniref:Uncharacterized protein n=1 Tax=Protopolystoma xenopodis TaxID=117903 RepID=A0A3S5CBZ7_9PLAT|nr:unnamed protein product [Protopolystoma xenopodis]